MAKVFIATIKNKGLTWNSDAHRSMFLDFLAQNDGKKLRIELEKNPVSDEMRGYYFAAVLPIVRKTCKEWQHLTSDELHEVLKKEFAYFEAWSKKNNRTERYATPVMSERSNTQKAIQYLQDIADYLASCGYEMPDPEEWKKYRDSAIINPKYQ
jgi:hypothetical protein